ncbi:MAG: mechanosensitive ion channel family protein [Candidatus Zixiibacteriota bacterium]|nr:MAG: mechanosensitive ion channel family protein [candidate division Zixibacteria bacterium]
MEQEFLRILTLLKEWAYAHLPRIIMILIGAWIVIRASRLAGRRILTYTEDEDPTTRSEREKRAETLVNIVNSAIKVFIYIIACFMILREVGVDIAPLLAGVGIAGLAIGFGAQTLVKDFLTGFFILMENQYRVGDVVKIGDHAGLVEKINMRTTILRDLEGVVHTVPNGEVQSVKNLTHGWSRVVLNIGVAYKENVDQVIEVLQEVGKTMRGEERYCQLMLDDPQVLGVDNFGESEVTIKMIAKTLPLKQWEVARELRRRIKYAFDQKGIEIPFPQRTLWMQKEES